jgi:DNA-binding NarL/FixJ family response regulator
VLAPKVASALMGLVGGSAGPVDRQAVRGSARELEVLRLVADGATNQPPGGG